MKPKILLYLLLIILTTLLTGCAQATTQATTVPSPTTVVLPTATLAPSPTPAPTETALPTQTPAPTATPVPPTETPYDAGSAIDKYLTGLTEEHAFTGAVLVAVDGQVLLSKGYGLANRETGTPITPQTRIRLCSITKQFTAMGIMILASVGLLAVDDPVCDHLEDCPSAWEHITIHDLLVHTSGIIDFTDLPEYEPTKDQPLTSVEVVARFKDLPLELNPGEQWRYSNSGYAVLGLVIETVSGTPYDQFIQENIFIPLGMGDSGFDHGREEVAKGYTGEGENWHPGDYIDMSVAYAAGALYSTVEDMYMWDQALYSDQLLPQELMEQVFKPYEDTGTPLGAYGYGWFITEKHNQDVFRHGGGGDGFVTMIERYPEPRLALILLSNRETTDLGAITDRVARMALAK
jgi:CubicO group peptidase (beta-lactamase class C family)